MLLKESANKRLSELKIKYNPNNLSKPITSSADCVRVLRQIWDTDMLCVQEQVYILFLNGGNQAICYRRLNTGTARQSLFDIKLAIACALSCLAARVIIAYNHPSESLRPSGDDIAITKQLKQACKLLDINLADHIILTRFDYYSFADNKLVV